MRRTMKRCRPFAGGLALLLALLLLDPGAALPQSTGGEKPFKQEELDQMLAPLALYPDSLLSQVLMASTYPLEVVEAARWVEQNQGLQGDELAKALEQQTWDPSVKSLVNFPQVLQMMNEKLDLTRKVGDAFLSQQQDVMSTIQSLRKKARAEGNLKTTEQQKVVVEKETQTIVIESPNPQVVYVPSYNPTAVYGAWPYPAYPPYSYAPPVYTPGAALFTFGAGVALGAAWGYAWGHADWGHGDVNVNMNRNASFNQSIDRSKYAGRVSSGQGGSGSWKHNPEHRQGVAYRDKGTAQQFNRGASRDAQTREAFRGRAEAGRQEIARGGADQFRGGSAGGRQGAQGPGGAGSAGRGSAQLQQRQAGGSDRAGSSLRTERTAFSASERGSQAKSSSSRGRESIASSRAAGGASGAAGIGRGGGGGGGGSRGGGGGRGGGGRR